ncbi:MAG: DbpA RNA binding domain-containing protein, partial [Tannerella sp.]|nr:DbpA RNA binding domain-containing protein [Tannerella sp.]
LEKEDIIKRIVSLEFNRLIDYYHDAGEIENADEKQSMSEIKRTRDGKDGKRRLSSDRAEEGMKILKINFGRKDTLIPSQLIELLNHCVKGKKVDIGRIELHDDFTLFEVDRAEAGRVMDALNSFEADGKAIVVKPAADKGRRPERSRAASNDRSGKKDKREGNHNFKIYYEKNKKRKKRN